MGMIKSDVLFMKISGELVVGDITRREKDYIEVSIVKPYCNWHSSLARSGMGRMSPYHFLTEHGDKAARSILLDIYNKISRIDADLPRFAELYQKLQMDCKLLDDNFPSGIDKYRAKSIKDKLNDWFFGSMLFTSSVTGIVPTIFERKIIEDIFHNYIHFNRKIYLQRLDN